MRKKNLCTSYARKKKLQELLNLTLGYHWWSRLHRNPLNVYWSRLCRKPWMLLPFEVPSWLASIFIPLLCHLVSSASVSFASKTLLQNEKWWKNNMRKRTRRRRGVCFYSTITVNTMLYTQCVFCNVCWVFIKPALPGFPRMFSR